MFATLYARPAEPILPLGLFRMNVFAVTSVVSFITGAAMFGAITFLPVYLQLARGDTPTQSGLSMLPLTAGILISSAISGRYMRVTGRYKILPIGGLATVAIGALLLTRITADMPFGLFAAYSFVFGLGLGAPFAPLTTSVQNAVPKRHLGTATAAGMMFRQIAPRWRLHCSAPCSPTASPPPWPIWACPPAPWARACA